METVLSYAYVNVSVRKHCLSKKITAHVMSAAISDLLDKLEFKSFFIWSIMRIFGIIFPKCLYTIFSNLLITLQPLPVYYFFKNFLRFFARKLIALSTKINAMVLCALKQKTPFDAASIMFCAAAT